MMLPGALPAIARSARANHTPLAAPRFAASYLIVWFAAGLATFTAYEPSAPAVAASAGLRFGAWCIGSSLGLMAAFVALDPMSLPLICLAGTIALIQKELFS